MSTDLLKEKDKAEKELQKAQEDLDIVSKELEKEVEERRIQKEAIEKELKETQKILARQGWQDERLNEARRTLKFMKDRIGDLVYDPEFLWLMICTIFASTEGARRMAANNFYFTDIVEAFQREKERSKNQNP